MFMLKFIMKKGKLNFLLCTEKIHWYLAGVCCVTKLFVIHYVLRGKVILRNELLRVMICFVDSF